MAWAGGRKQRCCHGSRKWVADQFVPELSNDARRRNNTIMLNDLEIRPDLDPWTAFTNICKCPWWSRAWIVQEFLLPLAEETFEDGRKSFILRRKTVGCGKKEAS
jgi:hypothetical protein